MPRQIKCRYCTFCREVEDEGECEDAFQELIHHAKAQHAREYMQIRRYVMEKQESVEL